MVKKAKGLSLILVLTLGLWGIFILPCFPQSTDKLTIVTYYPSPYGVYNQLVTRALGVGDNDDDGSITSADAPDPTANPGELWVAGHIYQTQLGKSTFLGYEAGLDDDLTDNKNVFVGYQAGYSNITGGYNSAVGYAALERNTTGRNNSAIGYNALNSNTTGGYNSAMGAAALYHTTGNNNSAMGSDALNRNTTGNNNSAMGSDALNRNTTGNNNSAMGYAALYSNTTGGYNSAVGFYALIHNTTGNNNTAVGSYALYRNTTGYFNSAVGYGAFYRNTTGRENSAMGFYTLSSNTTGSYNSAVGYNALTRNTTGRYNSAMGFYTLYRNTTGGYNSAMGMQAGSSIANGSANRRGNYNVFLGANTKAHADGDRNEIVIGYNATGIGSNSVVLGNNSIVTTALKGSVGIGTTSPGGDKLDVRGRAYASGGWQTTNADYAEWIEKEENCQPGDIIGIDLKTGKARVYKSGDEFIGICSINPAVIGNRINETDAEMKKHSILVGLVGQLEFNKNQVKIDGRIVKTKDNKKIGILLNNGKVLIGK